MTITQNDLAILKTERMTDTPDGGGLPTAEPVIDGVSNNLFPDVSDIDALTGRVRLRKIVLAVKTANDELLQAARFLITELPSNPNMSVFAFEPTSFADTRSDAQNKIESYLAFGTKWAGHLLETQLQGQKVIQVSLELNDAVPSVGQALVLVENEAQPDEKYQYVRVRKVEIAERRFQKNADTSVTRKVATLEISEALRYTFNGLTVQEFYQNTSTKRRAILREARIADAARYYSASHLAEPITALQSRQVLLKSIYTQVVPSTQIETPLLQRDPVNQQVTLIKSGDGLIQIDQIETVNPATALNLASGVYAGSLTLNVNNKILTDSNGELVDASMIAYGSIKYDLGQITWYDNANWGQKNITGSYKPATAVTRIAQTDYQIVDDNAGYSYIRELGAEPVPTTLTVSYQVNNRVYVVHDNGRGSLVDSAGNGRGSLRGKTVLLSTEAIPDAGSYIIYSFGTDLNTVKYSAQSLEPAYHVIPLNGTPSGDIAITWGDKTATASDGVVTGDATGKVVGDKLYFAPTLSLAVDTKVNLTYDLLSETSLKPVTGKAVVNESGNLQISAITTDAFTSGEINVRIADALVSLKFNTTAITKAEVLRGVRNNKITGGLQDGNGAFEVWTADNSYTVNIISSAVDVSAKTITTEISVTKVVAGVEVLTRPNVSPIFKTWSKVVSMNFDGAVLSGSARTSASGTPTTLEHIVKTMFINLPKTVDSPILSGSIAAIAMDSNITDKAGLVFSNKLQIGTVDYNSGIVTLEQWNDKTLNSVLLRSMTRENDPVPLSNIIFRTPVAPLKKSSLTINCTLADGTELRLQTNEQGQITGHKFAHGSVEFKTGVVSLYFYEKLKVAENPNINKEPWYDVDAIYTEAQTGTLQLINRPVYVKPDSIRYNAIAYTYLPLNADIVGLDPVRLPTDGRVQFVRAGDSVAITELKTKELATAAVNDVINLGFERLSDVTVVDSNNVRVDKTMIDADLDAGILTLNSSFSSANYAPPFTVKYRIMDLAQVLETDISGRVTLSTTVTHDYTTNAVFSSMLLAGDLQARASNVFSQKAWNGVWSNQLIGDSITSQLLLTDNPIVVTNRDSLQERWALIFTSATEFRIVGEIVGEIGKGSTTSDTSPINPVTGYPYFTIRAASWGAGWSAGNVVRFNTAAAKHPIWLGNAIQQHQINRLDNYDFAVGFHANVDRERVVT